MWCILEHKSQRASVKGPLGYVDTKSAKDNMLEADLHFGISQHIKEMLVSYCKFYQEKKASTVQSTLDNVF